MDNKIILKARGKITADNVAKWKESFLETIGGSKKPDIVVDLEEVYYISSAGLRLMLFLRGLASSIELINASPDVYDVFSVTGLTAILNVRRRFKDISCDGLKVLGKGVTATVYRYNDEQIVKIYNEDVKEEDLLLEQDKTRKAFLAGVPTMIAFDTVSAGDRLGAIYEAFNFDTLFSVYIKASDDERQVLTRKYARTVRQMCRVEVQPVDFTDFKAVAAERLEKAKERLDEKTYVTLQHMIDQIPDEDRFVHGDCHMENLMLDPDGNMVVIDLGISGFGNAVFALSGVAHYKVFIELIEDENAFKEKSGLSFAESEELYHRFMDGFCEGLDEDKTALVDQGVYLYCCLLSALEYVGTPLVTDECFKSLTDRAAKASDSGFDFSGMFDILKGIISEKK